MKSDYRPLGSTPSPASRRSRRRLGFTLVELLVATTILGLGMSMTLVAYVAVLKRGKHTEYMLKGAAELRYASDLISEAVRSSSQDPTVPASGLQLIVAPPEMGALVVQDGTWLDSPLNTVRGTKSNQRNLKLSNTISCAAVVWAFKGAARPSGALASSDIATYFSTNSASLPQVDVNDVLASGDVISVPATAFGYPFDVTVNNISNSSNGTQTVSTTTDMLYDVPNGTRIRMVGGRRQMFEVTAGGDLRYYSQYLADDDRGAFIVLAREIDSTPLIDPTIAETSANQTKPFSVAQRVVKIVLQKSPKGHTVGRTVQGVRTTAYGRSDPTAQ